MLLGGNDYLRKKGIRLIEGLCPLTALAKTDGTSLFKVSDLRQLERTSVLYHLSWIKHMLPT